MITRFNIEKREPFADRYEFPITGEYEKLTGKACGEVDPKSRFNKVLVNVDKAARNKNSRVEYSSDFCILKPVDMERGNGKIFFDVPNRGSKRIVAFLNDAAASNDPSTLEHAGNGFLMRQGYTIAWCGWQGDLLPQKNWLVMGVPTATNNGKEIVRKVRNEIVVTETGVKSQPLSADERVQSYEASLLDKSFASLTVRVKSYGERTVVPESEWEFAVCEKDPLTGRESTRPSTRHLYLPAGFKPGHIYELIYPAKNPLILGLGFAAVRDFVSFLRYEVFDKSRQLNPLVSSLCLPLKPRENTRGGNKTDIHNVYGWGRSQSGRFLRDFVFHGFNEDESGRKVFDAVAPHVAGGGRLYLNYVFARPVTSSQQHTNQLDPELFPFAYNIVKDPQTGRRDGILKRRKTDPCVFHTQTSTEYWQKRGCLAHTDGKGKDLRLPENVRVYVIASAQHNSPFGSEPERQSTQNLVNPLPAGDVLRALMVALDLWITHGVPPPPSQYPTVRDGTLVPPDRQSTGFPRIPGVNYTGLYNRQLFLDYGPLIGRGLIDVLPPRPIGNKAYKIFVPKVDADGNDVAGIRLPQVQVPLGTYTGWNVQSDELSEGELSGLLGSFIPFANTKAERRKRGDPRLSIEERYKDEGDYVLQVSRAARKLVEDRFLLPEDAARIIAETENMSLLRD